MVFAYSVLSQDRITKILNRLNAIDRIEFVSGFDRSKASNTEQPIEEY